MKKNILLIFIFIFSLTLVACNKKNNTKEGEIIINGTKTFSANELFQLIDSKESENITLSNNSLILIDETKQGTYQSIPISIESYLELVLSWNVKNLGDGQILFLVSIGNDNDMSDFFMMASWKEGNNRSFSSASNEFGTKYIDTITNLDPNNNKVILRFVVSPSSNSTININNLTVTTKQNNNEVIFNENNLFNKKLDVPPLQQLSIPNIGNIICSPTSVAMVLNYYENNFTQLEVANSVLDKGASIYGNWTFNASYAGSLDNLFARVEYIHNFDTVINYIKNDIPVIFSITTKTVEELEGSIMAFPGGHLIVLIGFEEIDGKWYGIFNDPAEHKDELVERKYSLDQMFKAWRGYTYIIQKEAFN